MAKVAKSFSSIRFSLNGREFYAEGEAAEVSRKLDEFMNSVFRPLRTGLAALNWRATLHFRHEQRVTLRMVESRFRKLAKVHHPDKGGDRVKFEEIIRARDAAKWELSQ